MKTVLRVISAVLTAVVLLSGLCGCKKQDEIFDIVVKDGYTGTQGEWLASLAGENGIEGEGVTVGESAYSIAVEKGYKGTVNDWYSIVAGVREENLDVDKTVYENAVANGYGGSLAQWLTSISSADLDDDIEKGEIPAYDTAKQYGFEGTFQEWLVSLIGYNGGEKEQ